MGNVFFGGGKVGMKKPAAGIPLSDLLEGQIVMINENGTPVPFYLAKHDYESGLNGTGRTLLVRKDCYDSRIIMDTNYGSGGALYTQSPLDAWANSDYKSLFDPAVQEAMGTTKFYYLTSRTSTPSTGTLERSVFILSSVELNLAAGYASAEGSILPIADTLKIAYLNGAATTQLTRTISVITANAFIGITASGGKTNVGANSKAGSRPCFTLPSTMLVGATPNADGSVNLLVQEVE